MPKEKQQLSPSQPDQTEPLLMVSFITTAKDFFKQAFPAVLSRLIGNVHFFNLILSAVLKD